MRYKAKVFPILAVFGLASTLSLKIPAASAQNPADEGLKYMSDLLGIPESSRFFKPLSRQVKLSFKKLEKSKRSGDEEGSEAPPKDNQDRFSLNQESPEPKELPVVKHYRGKLGVPLPTREEIVNPFYMSPAQIRARLEELKPTLDAAAAEVLTAPQMPRCETDSTEEIKLPVEEKLSREERKELVMDMLFIEEGDIPLDPDEVFGQKTVIRPYRAGTDDTSSLMARSIGITCLPTRIRITRTRRLEDHGINALMNYEKDQHEKGVLHEKYSQTPRNMGAL